MSTVYWCLMSALNTVNKLSKYLSIRIDLKRIHNSQPNMNWKWISFLFVLAIVWFCLIYGTHYMHYTFTGCHLLHWSCNTVHDNRYHNAASSTMMDEYTLIGKIEPKSTRIATVEKTIPIWNLQNIKSFVWCNKTCVWRSVHCHQNWCGLYCIWEFSKWHRHFTNMNVIISAYRRCLMCDIHANEILNDFNHWNWPGP